jgi:hypothetical protein
MVAAYRRGTFGTGVVRGNGLAIQQSGVVSLGSVAAQGDTNFASNVLLAKTTSVNTATNNTFLDSSSNALTITRNGTPTQGSFTPYWPSGYWSMYGGGSDTVRYTGVDTALTFPGNFTIEGWYNLVNFDNSGGGNPGLIGYGTNNWVLVLPGGAYNFYATGSLVLSSSAVASANVWNHFALVRNGSSIVIYHNGVSVGTATNSSTLSIGSSGVTIGSNGISGVGSITGYMSNVRVVKGTAVYTGAFTPPTTPLTAIANTSLLSCQDNRFKDNSANNFTVVTTGTPKIQAFQPFNPPAAYSTLTHGGSGYFNGSTDYLTTPTVTALQLGTGDFTIECWSYLTSKSTNYPAIFSNYNSYTTGSLALFAGHVSGSTTAYQLAINGASFPVVQGGTIVYNTWVHLAVVRYNGTISLYVNGTSVGTPYSTAVTLNGAGANFYIGTTGDSVSTSYINGYLSNFRVVKGTAVYTAAFAPPTAPVTAIANTSLLANFTNAGIYDTAVQNDAVTVGDAQVSTTVYKWSPTSMKFDGTGDYLTTPSNPALALRTGDFTVEFWMYPTAAQTGDIIDTRVSGDSANSWCVQLDNTNINFTGPGSNYLSYPYTINTWTHVAYTRVSGSVSVYINGTKYGSSVTLTNDFTGTVYKIGATFNNFYYAGYIQDLRVTKGLARYTANFTAPTATFSNSTASTYTPAVPDAPIIANITTITNTSVKIGYMAPLLNGGSTITSYTAVSTPGGFTGTSVTSRSGTITVSGLAYSNTYTFAVYATNAVGTSTYSASSKGITTGAPPPEGKIFILSEMELALTDFSLLNTTIATGITKAKSYALASIYGSD